MYAATHAIFYGTDFGEDPCPAQLTTELSPLLEAMMIRALDADDFDLVAELLLALWCLRSPITPAAHLAWQTLVATELEVGILPALGSPRELRTANEVALAHYHTGLVMTMLCAAMARRPLVPLQSENGFTDSGTARGTQHRRWVTVAETELVGKLPQSILTDVLIVRAAAAADVVALNALLNADSAAGSAIVCDARDFVHRLIVVSHSEPS